MNRATEHTLYPFCFSAWRVVFIALLLFTGGGGVKAGWPGSRDPVYGGWCLERRACVLACLVEGRMGGLV